MTAPYKLSTEIRLAYENRDRDRLESLLLKIDELEERAKPQQWPPAMAKLVDQDDCKCGPWLNGQTRTFIGSTDGSPMRCTACGKVANFIAYANPAPHAACGVGLQYSGPANAAGCGQVTWINQPEIRPVRDGVDVLATAGALRSGVAVLPVRTKPDCTCGCPAAGMAYHEHDCPAR